VSQQEMRKKRILVLVLMLAMLIQDVYARQDRREQLKKKYGDQFEGMWKEVNKSFVDQERWQRTAMTQDFLLSFETDGIAGSEKALNARQKKIGVTYSALVVDRIEFKNVVKSQNSMFEGALVAELNAREIPIPRCKGKGSSPNFNDMKKNLKIWVKENDAKAKANTAYESSFEPIFPGTWKTLFDGGERALDTMEEKL